MQPATALDTGVAEPERADLRAEVAWLANAEAALRARDAEAALRVLSAERQRFERGQLRDERRALQLIALCMLGRDVSEPLQRYLEGAADGVLVARVRNACGVPSPGR